jgi:plasmid stability protein
MRTTLDIPDEIYRRLKIKAATEGKPFRAIALRGILLAINESDYPPLPRLSEPILKSYAPGSIDIDNERIYDLIGFP